MFIIIAGSEDGTVLHPAKDLEELNAYLAEGGFCQFVGQHGWDRNWAISFDTNHWPDNMCMILDYNPIVPKAVEIVRRWKIEN